MEKDGIETSHTTWKSFYITAGVMAALIVLVGLLDTITSMLGGEAKANSLVSITEWLALFQSRRFYAFSNLGIINITTLTLGIPVYNALHNLHRRNNPGFSSLANNLFLVGTAIYISSNTVLSMWALSRQYAFAPDVQKPLLEAAGQAVLALGADLTPGTFMGFFFTQLAGITMTLVMARSGIFSKFTALAGLAGFALTSVFFILSAFVPSNFDKALAFATPGGLLLMAYHILLALKFFQLGKRD